MFKKALLILLCLVLVFSTAACGSGGTSVPSGNKDGSGSQPTPGIPVNLVPSDPAPSGDTTPATPAKPAPSGSDQPPTPSVPDPAPVPSGPKYSGTRSVQHRTAKSGNSATTNGYSTLVKQDDTLFYITPKGNLCSRTMSGNSTQVLFNIGSMDQNRLTDFQVVGDWVYFQKYNQGHDYMNYVGFTLSRVKIDGTGLEVISTDIPSEDFNTFIVRDGFLYFVTHTKTQVSASKYHDTCQLVRMDLNSRDTQPLFTLDDCDDLRICAYNDDRAIVQGNDVLYMMDLNSGTVDRAPESMRSFDGFGDAACGWMPGPDGAFYLYHVGHGMLYRFLPENGYAREEFQDMSKRRSRYDQPTISPTCEIVFLSRDSFITNGKANSAEKESLWLYENGERRLIAEDYGANLSCPGDGYLYYTYRSMWPLEPCGDRNCRIKLDGSGWESLDW